MFVTGPSVVKEVLNEDVSFEELGGAQVHASKSGVADFIYNDEEHCLLGVKKLLSYLPSNHLEHAPKKKQNVEDPSFQEKISYILPEDPSKPYDMNDIVNCIVDHGSYFEVGENFAGNIITGFGRLDGATIGIIANQPKIMAGTRNNFV